MLQLQQSGEDLYNHAGVSMMLECVMKHSKPRPDAESLDTASLNRRPDCVKRDFSSFIGQMNEKYTYAGIVQGLRKNVTDANIVAQLAKEIRSATSAKSQKELKAAMLKAAAFLATAANKSHNFERSLLHELSRCCAAFFTKQTIQVAIDCWSWIISARPDTEPLVVEEMINAWQMSVDLRVGMFSASQAEPSPLARVENDMLRLSVPLNVDAHRIWIK